MPVDDKRLPSSVGLTLMLLFLSFSLVSKGNRGERVKSMENRRRTRKKPFSLSFSLFKYQSMKESVKENSKAKREEREREERSRRRRTDSCHWISCESE